MADEKAIVNESGTEGSVRKPAAAASRSAVEQQKKKPVVTKSVRNSDVNFVLISIGQGGWKIARTLVDCLPNNPFPIAINTSNQDLDLTDLPDNQRLEIGGVRANGAGQNRNRAKLYYKNFSAENTYNQEMDVIKTFISLYEEVLFNPVKQNIIIVSFTTDGGSGSGIGPMFVTALTNYVNSVQNFVFDGKTYEIDDATNFVPRPVVIGLCPKCRISEGSGKLENNIECFLDIQKAIDRKIGHFFIADNNLDAAIKYSNTDEMYKIINTRIAAPLLKFLGIEMNSDIKCMDLQDKINALRISGASSFVSVEPKGLFQYCVPHGQSVTRVISMLKYDPSDPDSQSIIEKKASDLLKEIDVISLDNTNVFFEVDRSSLDGIDSVTKELLETSMLALIGYNSLGSIIEDLRYQSHKTIEANDKKHQIIRENSTGFDSIERDSKELADRFGSKTMDQDAINDLF